MTTTQDMMIEVPGAKLRYRLVGKPAGLPLLVFENGWGASYETWAWVERFLAPQTRLLFYDRAGIGGSELTAPQSVAGLSSGLAALLAALKIDEPVVVVGHSYGGLMGALHVAQQPQIVRALIPVDATPDRPNAKIDAQLGMMRYIGKLSIALARLHLRNPVFAPAGAMLPEAEGKRLMQLSFNNPRSLRAAMVEMQLLGEIRAAIAGKPVPCPALVISAGKMATPTGLMARLVPPGKAEALLAGMQALHREKASEASPGTWDALPHDHGALVFSEAGSAATAERIMAYLGTL